MTSIDLNAVARDCYEQFAAHNTYVRPWEELTELTRESWRRVALRALGYVVDRLPARAGGG